MTQKLSQSFRLGSGFTLLELMVVVAIVGILAGISAQTFSGWMRNSQTREASDSLRASISYARAESITRGGNVRLCGSDNGSSCAATLSGGWLVYHDVDVSNSLSATDRVLLWHQQDHAGVAVAVANFSGVASSEFGFNYRGYPSMALTLTVARHTASRSFVLHRTGRVEAL